MIVTKTELIAAYRSLGFDVVEDDGTIVTVERSGDDPQTFSHPYIRNNDVEELDLDDVLWHISLFDTAGKLRSYFGLSSA